MVAAWCCARQGHCRLDREVRYRRGLDPPTPTLANTRPSPPRPSEVQPCSDDCSASRSSWELIVAIGVGIAIVVKKLTTPADIAVPIEPWPPLPSENAMPDEHQRRGRRHQPIPPRPPAETHRHRIGADSAPMGQSTSAVWTERMPVAARSRSCTSGAGAAPTSRGSSMPTHPTATLRRGSRRCSRRRRR